MRFTEFYSNELAANVRVLLVRIIKTSAAPFL